MTSQHDIVADAERVGELEKRPDDGWVRGDPYPLGSSARGALHGLIRALLPKALPYDKYCDQVEHQVRFQMRYMEPIVALGLKLAFYFLDWSPIWRFKRLSRLRNLQPEVASEILNDIAHSRLGVFRLMIMGVRATIGTTIYDLDEVHQQLDYDPRPWMQNRIALRRRLLAGQKATNDDMIGPHSHVRIEGEDSTT